MTPLRSVWISAAALLTLLATLLFAAGAQAGSYEVRACDERMVNRAFVASGTAMVAADASCSAMPFLGMRVRNSLGAGSAAAFSWGALEASAPAGNVITSIRAQATAYDPKAAANIEGWRAGIADDSGYRWCGMPMSCAWSGAPGVSMSLTGLATTKLRLMVICALGSGCPRNAIHATTTLRDVILELRDNSAPQVGPVGGALAASGWVAGRAAGSFEASDSAGIRRASLVVDGATVAAAEHQCDQYAMAPCPNGGVDGAVDTSRLGDGQHTLTARAVDAAGNVSEQQKLLKVDNNAPLVDRPDPAAGSGWSADPAPVVGVAARDGAGGSGVQSLRWELCRVDRSDCRSGIAPVDAAAAALKPPLPAPGEWQLRVAASDALREGPISDWSAPLRYDPAVPGAARLDSAARWSDGRRPVAVALAPAAAPGPSGIAGYAVSSDGSAPGAAISASGEHPVVSLSGLPEGVTSVAARAISGAGVAGLDVGRLAVGIDRTAPTLTLALADGSQPAREEWFGRPIELLAAATDQATLSGLDAAPADQPVTSGGYVEYRIDDREPQLVRGASAPIRLSEDGIHSVTARAVDLAGNVSAARTVSYRIDRHRPSGALLRPVSADPRRLAASVDEGCIASAVLELRRSGQRSWEYIEGRVGSHEVSALVPDDRLPAGTYEARMRVTDCAGNEGMITKFADGSRGLITLPLRMAPALSAGLVGGDQKAHQRLTVKYGRPVTVTARLTDADGLPMASIDVELRQRIGAGSWRPRAARTTGSDGRVRFTLPAGPSRALQLAAEQSITSTGALSAVLQVNVPAKATIKVARRSLRNGQAAHFSGRLYGGYLPAKGREIELQGYNPLRRRWQPIRTEGLRCDRRGRWRAAYRFTATVGRTVTYRFRVRIAPRPDHPFAEGHSGSVAVRVRG